MDNGLVLATVIVNNDSNAVLILVVMDNGLVPHRVMRTQVWTK